MTDPLKTVGARKVLVTPATPLTEGPVDAGRNPLNVLIGILAPALHCSRGFFMTIQFADIDSGRVEPVQDPEQVRAVISEVCLSVFKTAAILEQELQHIYYSRPHATLEEDGIDAVALQAGRVRLVELSGDMPAVADACVDLGNVCEIRDGIKHYARALDIYRNHGYQGYGLSAWAWYADRLWDAGMADAAKEILVEMMDTAVAHPIKDHIDALTQETSSTDQLADLIRRDGPDIAKKLSAYDPRTDDFEPLARAWKEWRADADQKHEASCKCLLCGGKAAL